MKLKLTPEQDRELEAILTILLADAEEYIERARKKGIGRADALEGWVVTIVATLLLMRVEEKRGRVIEVEGWTN
jgi:hypothetical protein